MADFRPRWTHDDDIAAAMEGWGVFDAGDGLEIERDDEAEMFDRDADAIAFVESHAKTGRDLHIRALTITREGRD